MKRLIFTMIFLLGAAAQATVLTETELRELETKQAKNPYANKLTLKHVEFQPVFKKGEFKYFQVYAEASVEVKENMNRWVWAPKKSAEQSLKYLMKVFCRDLGGEKLKKKKEDSEIVDHSTRTQMARLFHFSKPKIIKHDQWEVETSLKTRCQ